MNWKALLEPEEWFVGAFLQAPLYFIVGWWVIPIMVLCGILWRLGGWTFGNKLFRRLAVPFLVCLSTFLVERHWQIFLAMPCMCWVAPSYGIDSWLFKIVKNDFLTRLICFAWFWTTFSIAYLISLA